jgi:plasmid stabilization system protein ParE
MSVRWTEHAAAEVAEIQAYLAQFSERAASRMAQVIARRGRQLELFPESGRIVPEFGELHIREVFAPPYRIVYRLTDDGVEVLAVRHGRRRMELDLEM